MNKFILLLLSFFFLLSAQSRNNRNTKTNTSNKRSISKADSVENIARRTYLLLRETMQKGIIKTQPKSTDSLFNNKVIYPYEVMQTDGPNLSDIYSKELNFISIKKTVSSGLNTSLYDGIPTPIIQTSEFGEILTPYPYKSPLPSRFSPREIYQIKVSPLDLKADLFPQNYVLPQSSILWQGGIKQFNENMFNIRFTRPFSKNLQVGVFTNYQHLNRTKYSHDHSGGPYGFFKPIYKKQDNENLLLDTGTNTLTNEFITGLRILHVGKNERTTKVSYQYGDIRADLPFENILDTSSSFFDTSETSDSVQKKIVWRESADYEHRLNLKINNQKITNKIGISTDILLQKANNTIKPIQKLDTVYSSGTRITYGGGISPYMSINPTDTLSVLFSVRRSATTRYDKSELVTHDTKLEVNYLNKIIDTKDISANFNLKTGYSFIMLNEMMQATPTISAIGNIRYKNQSLSLYAKSDVMPPSIPYAINTSLIPGDHRDAYQTFGVEAVLRWKSQAILLSYRGVRNVDARSDSLYWVGGISPYRTPNNSYIITPSIFTNKAISLRSQWIFTDRKPYIKSKSNLKFHIHRDDKVQHVFVDFYLTYWSYRDKIIYAGIDNWNNQLLNLDIKITLQVATFRLFYKMDNFFNRKNSYIPGYKIPGLILHWGMNWQITG